MKVGIAGFPRSGKTTIFNALSGQQADVGGFTDKVHLGSIKVPDARIDWLSEQFKPRKTTYAEMVFVDFPPPADGGSSGALDQGTLTQMREADALVQVVRGFLDPIVEEPPDPVRDVNNFKGELVLADLAIVEKRLERLKKEKGKEREVALLQRCKELLDAETPLRHMELATEEVAALSGFGFISRLPMMVVLNVGEADLGAGMPAALQQVLQSEKIEGLVLSGKIEAEISALEAADRQAFLEDLGLKETARDRFIRAAYQLLDQVSFLTAGEDEVRAWTIKRGTSAVKAAGKIHSDIERGFIRAEITAFDDFKQYGSEAKCREVGKLRLEGKEYVVQDGDIAHFRFNV
jgi:GTP-binding protein YchF